MGEVLTRDDHEVVSNGIRRQTLFTCVCKTYYAAQALASLGTIRSADQQNLVAYIHTYIHIYIYTIISNPVKSQ